MAVFTAASQEGKAARCGHCSEQLYNLFCKSGCGRPLAVCSLCKRLYILDRYPFTNDMLADYFWSHSLPNGKWKWMPMQKFCAEVLQGSKSKNKSKELKGEIAHGVT